MEINLTSFGQTDVGLKRQKNEDSYLIDANIGVYIVADGMGGHKGGDMASSMAVKIMRDTIFHHIQKSGSKFSPRDAVTDGYLQASQQIFHKSNVESPELQGMGTTLVVSFFHNGVLYIGNVGDSRAYLIRDKRMWQLTEDHSLLNEHIRAGFLRDSEIAQFQAKNVITRSVGFEKEAMCDIVEKNIQSGDRIMLCSDGLCGLVKGNRLLELCTLPKIEDAVSACIDEAKKNGGDDNITCVMIDAGGR